MLDILRRFLYTILAGRAGRRGEENMNEQEKRAVAIREVRKVLIDTLGYTEEAAEEAIFLWKLMVGWEE